MNQRNVYFKLDEAELNKASELLTEGGLSYRTYYDPLKIICEEAAEQELDIDLLSEDEDNNIAKANNLTEYMYSEYLDNSNLSIHNAILKQSFNKWVAIKK